MVIEAGGVTVVLVQHVDHSSISVVFAGKDCYLGLAATRC